MQQAPRQAQFIQLSPGPSSTNFGNSNGSIWLSMALRPERDALSLWMLEIAHPPLDIVEVYLVNAEGTVTQQTGGDLRPFSARNVRHRNHVFALQLEPDKISTLYLRAQSQGTLIIPVTLWQPQALWRSDQQSYSMFSLYFGLLIGLVLYNLLLYLSVRDPAYIIYVGFAGFVGLSQLTASGLGAQFLWPDSVWWGNIATNVAYATSGAFGIAFARTFLSTRTRLPRIDRLLQVVFVLYLIALVMSLVMPYSASVLMVKIAALSAMAAIVITGTISVVRKHPGAKYFALAWSMLISSMVVLAFHNFGWIPSTLLTANPVLIGSALEMLLLSFALADRINQVRQDKELALAQVSAEKATVLALNQSQERYRSVIEHVSEGMLVLQEDRIVFANFRATEILEVTKTEIMASGIVERMYAPDRLGLANFIRDRLTTGTGSPTYCQARLEIPGRALKWLEFGNDIVPWDDSQGLLLYFLDVTQRHNAELETRAALNRQQELIELRARFVAMTSHEFRTPLAAILSAQELLKTFDDRLPPTQRAELLGIIESAVARMSRMSERVLLLGQIEAQMLEFKPKLIDIKPLCEELVVDATSQQGYSTCQVVAEFSEPLVPALYDDKLIRHIFGNLLSNAIKYSPAGGLVRLQVDQQGARTLFEVSDQGIGIPEAEIAGLFESFHRASNVGAIQGTGLGLAIVKQAVDLHGGSISVRSTLGGGTCFKVLLGE